MVAGQRSARSQVDGLLKENKVKGNTLLLSGPYGTGKTTVGRIIAKSLNCTEKGPFAACGKCSSCRLTIDTHPDITEINAAEARGIDQVRQIIETAHFSPRYESRVFILDEIHQLTATAAQSFLKALEEPPPHVTFILVTTDPHKLLKTILSRTVHIKFSTVSDREMTRYLSKVAEKENLGFDKGVYEHIADMSEGHVRDALTLLDQLASSSPEASVDDAKKQLPELAAKILGASPHSLVPKYVRFLVEGNLSSMVCFRKVDNIGYFMKVVVQFLKDYCVYLASPGMLEDKTAKFVKSTVGSSSHPSYEDLVSLLGLHMEAISKIESGSSAVDVADFTVLKSRVITHGRLDA
tara:strand:- start:68 stop:1123 length:1056 start_codon:yes stop_codon:yes gene_type:complete